MAASPGRKEEPVAARVFRWAGGERRGVIAVVKEVKPIMLVTLEVQDTQRRVVTCTMRRTSKLQGLIDYYYDVVWCSGDAGARGTGRFVFDGECLKGEHTPEGLGMVSGDKIDFFGDSRAAHGAGGDMEEVDRKMPVITPGVHLTLKVKDTEGRTLKRTVRSTQKLQVLMDAYYASVPDVTYGTGSFLYDGKRVRGRQTPAELEMEQRDEIDFFTDMLGGVCCRIEQPPVPACGEHSCSMWCR